MSTKRFFEHLQNHSNAKIEILHRYYVPWLRKITLGPFNNNKCLVIDGFAGEGIYEDGSLGSPIVMIDEAIAFCNQNQKSSKTPPSITIVLIEGLEENFIKLYNNLIQRYDLIEEEKYFTIDGYESIKILILNNTFENVMNDILDNSNNLRPSFCFVDPFGFSNTPFHIFERFLENNKSEILFNFMYEEINRFITYTAKQKITKQFEDLFGSDNLDELRNDIRGTGAPIRKEKIMNYYSKQLLEKTNAQYVLNFEFKKKSRTKMFLVHATKNINGLALMKEVMWKVDETGAFLYDDKIDSDQITFEFFDDSTKKEHQEKLAQLIYEKFKKKQRIKLETIECFVLENTIYPLPNYYKKAMTILENTQLIAVVRKEGTKKNSYNDKTLYINF